jgi:hypothetical protein
MALDHLCRAFGVQAVYQPGESLTVAQAQLKDFDWSADTSGGSDFPVEVEVLQSGWRAGDAVLVLPKVTARQSVQDGSSNA